MASSMIYSYIPILPPLLLALARNQQPTQSDEDLAREFKLPSAAYTEKRGKHTIDIHWQSYLALNNYLFPFQPLRGTERDRYGPIIKAARDEETRRHYFECETFHALLDAEPWIEKLCNTPLALLLNRRGLKHPRKSLLPTSEQLTKDKLTVQRGLDKLREIYVGYLEPGLRHYRQHPDFFKRRFMTKFGVVTACCILPDEPWYLGHRPGDPIGRVRRDPQRRKPTEEEKLFVVPELAGSEDGDEIEKYAIRFEGVVPFSYRELYQRFTRYAFPRFVLMVIAALGFDPQDPEYKVHPHMKQVEKLLTREFIKISDRDRAASLKLLRRIWHVKYCNVAEKYPRFLKNQIVSSISRLREMGWLMSKLEREAPSPIGCHYWKHCKGLLEDMAGRDAAWLAQEYFDITLAAEAEELMGDGNMENILLYKHSRKSRDIAKLQDFYEPGGGSELSLKELEKLHDTASKYLNNPWYSELPVSQSPQPQPVESVGFVGLNSTSRAEDPTGDLSITVATSKTTKTQADQKKRKRSVADGQEKEEAEADLPAPLPKKRGRPPKHLNTLLPTPIPTATKAKPASQSQNNTTRKRTRANPGESEEPEKLEEPKPAKRARK